MKIGIKTYYYQKGIEYFKDKADFIEVMAIETENYDFLDSLALPVVVHSQHQMFGVNNADKTKYEQNLKSINYAIKLADSYKAKKIIVHPGVIDNESCSKENSISFLKSIKDKRILIENMPPNKKGKKALCSTPEEMKEFLKATGKKFCFDINHAIETALFLNADYMDYIKEFLKLKQSHYHFGGQKITSPLPHISLNESELNSREIIALLSKNAEITLETSPDIEKIKDDVNLAREVISNSSR